MGRYYLFAGHEYYPTGGMDDLIETFDTQDEAVEWFKNNPSKITESYINLWGHVYDLEARKITCRMRMNDEGFILEQGD